MNISWRSGNLLLRSNLPPAVALFAATCTAVLGQSEESCRINEAVSVAALDLDACRPKPVGAQEKAAVLRLLPIDGTISQRPGWERNKFEAIGKVLRVNGRDNVYDVRVIKVPQAWTGLHERAVLLISLPALTLLKPQELQALAAHEIGHEYVWKQYADAKVRRDAKRLRALELVCDAIAIRILERVGVRPERLQTATEKIVWYNRERLGIALDEGNYPSVKERGQLIKELSLSHR